MKEKVVIENMCTLNKENDPKGASYSDKLRDSVDEPKNDDEIKLDIGDHYHVKRVDGTWRK